MYRHIRGAASLDKNRLQEHAKPFARRLQASENAPMSEHAMRSSGRYEWNSDFIDISDLMNSGQLYSGAVLSDGIAARYPKIGSVFSGRGMWTCKPTLAWDTNGSLVSKRLSLFPCLWCRLGKEASSSCCTLTIPTDDTWMVLLSESQDLVLWRRA